MNNYGNQSQIPNYNMNNNMNSLQRFNQQMQQQQYQQPQQYNLLEVNGRNEMEMLNMMPNNKVIALDKNNPVLWYAQTDNTGQKTISAFNITPIKNMNEIDSNLKESITQLEERIQKLEGVLNDGKFNSRLDDKRKSTNGSAK